MISTGHIMQQMISCGQLLLLYDPTHDVHMSCIAAIGIPLMTFTNIWSYSWCPQVIYCRQWYPVDDFYCYIAANGIPWTISTAIWSHSWCPLVIYCSQLYPVNDFYCYIAANGIPWTTSTAKLQPMVSRGQFLLLYNPNHDVHMSYIAANGIPWTT